MGLGFHGPPNRWQLWGLSVQPSVLDQEAGVEGVSGSTARTLAFAPGPLPDAAQRCTLASTECPFP